MKTPLHEPPSPLAAIASGRAGGVRAVVVLGAACVAAVVTYVILPRDVGELARRALAIGVWAVILWATEALPLFVTSLCVVGLQVLLLARRGGLAGVGEFSYAQFFEPFASSTVILFLGGFLLAAAVTKHGLDRAIAARLLQPFTRNSVQLVFAVLLTTGFLSIWISNTATAAMMLAIIAPLIRDRNVPPSLAASLVLAVAFAASIGGIATPVSTPPNAITISQLKTIGVEISFVKWMLMALPLAFGMLVLTGLLLVVVLRPPRKISVPAIEAPRKLSWRGWTTIGVVLAAVAAWLTGTVHHVDDAAIALIAATVLAALGVLDRNDVRAIDWDILLLMWGGLALGNALNLTGVLEVVSGMSLFQQSGWMLALVIIVAGMAFSTFMSNTASANVLVPLAIALAMAASNSAVSDGAAANGAAVNVEAARLAVLAGLTVTFAIALPISTPPNAMAYATGKVSSKQMIAVGALVSIVAIAVMMVGYLWVLPWVLGMR